jgi:capsular exopolysaccharide synthesis family protein
MDIRAYVRAITKRFWLLALCCAAGAAVGLAAVSRYTPTYSASTTLALNPAAVDTLLPFRAPERAEDLAASYAQYLKTYSFAGRVARAIEPPITSEEVLSSISVQFVNGTQFFRISATASTPAFAQILANTAARVCVDEVSARQEARRQREAERSQAFGSVLNSGLAYAQQKLNEQIQSNRDQTLGLERRLADLQDQPPSEERDREIINLRQAEYDLQALNLRVMATLADLKSSQNTSGDPAEPAGVAIVDEAPLPTRPNGPNPLPMILYACAASTAIGLAGVFVLEALDDSYQTSDDLDRSYGLPTLGVIPDARRHIPNDVPLDQALRGTIDLAFAGAFRMLRTDVQLTKRESPTRTILVTSALPAEGKTTVATNLAVAFAQVGNRVILVDANSHRSETNEASPRLTRGGLAMQNQDSAGELIASLKRTDVPGLRRLGVGLGMTERAYGLGPAQIEAMLDALAREADVVVVDGPSVLAVSDALTLASRVDAVIQVIRAGKTRREVVRRGQARLEGAGAHLLGAVLNGAQADDVPDGLLENRAYPNASSVGTIARAVGRAALLSSMKQSKPPLANNTLRGRR